MYWILLEFATLLSAQSQLFNKKNGCFLLQILNAAIFTAGNPLGTPSPSKSNFASPSHKRASCATDGNARFTTVLLKKDVDL